MENDDCIVFLFETYENKRFLEVEEWKTMTVLLFCLKAYENIWVWEVDEWKTMNVLFLLLENV